MDREEILSRSRKENKDGDERDRFFEARSETVGTIVTVFTLMTLIIVSDIWGRDILGYLCVLFGGALGEMIGKLRKNLVGAIVGIVIFGGIFLALMIWFFRGGSLVTSVLWDSFWS